MQTFTNQIDQEKCFLLKKVKNNWSWIYAIEVVNGEQIFGRFYERRLKNISQTEFRVEKLIKKNNKCYVIWKDYDNSFNSCMDAKSNPDHHSRNKEIFQLDFSSNATKSEVKKETDVDRSKFAKHSGLSTIVCKIYLELTRFH